MGIRENIELDVIGKVVNKTDKPWSDEFADRVRWGALSAITGMTLRAVPIVSSLLKKKISLKDAYKLNKIPVAAFGLAGVPLGWNLPRVHNKYLEYAQGQATKTEAQEAYTKLTEEVEDTKKRSPLLFKKTPPIFKKESSLLSNVANVGGRTGGSILGGAFAAAKRTGGLLGKGVVGTANTVPTASGGMRRTFGGGLYTWGSRMAVGGAATAGVVGANSLYQSKRKLSGQNYTTFLRNNVLAGNIKPDQLSQQDLISVRKIGIR